MLTPKGYHTGETPEEIAIHLDNVLGCWKELVRQVRAAYKEMGCTSDGLCLLGARRILAKHTQVDGWPDD